MKYEHPAALLARLKVGREEFCQRLLTMMVLGREYPRWNTRNPLSSRGEQFLQNLQRLSFGEMGWADNGLFVDELELPPRHEAEKGGAPDQAVIWTDRLWMIELKTEKGSHRPAQIPLYFELGSHYYPSCSIDLTYVTPPMSAEYTPRAETHRYAHVTWPQIADLVLETWGDDEDEEPLLRSLLDAIEYMTSERPAAHRARVLQEKLADRALGDPIEDSLELAALTAADGLQRAFDYKPSDLEELLEIRKGVRDRICQGSEESPLRFVRPWLWRPESTGVAMTSGGREVGFELRLSRYRERVC